VRDRYLAKVPVAKRADITPLLGSSADMVWWQVRAFEKTVW
jgi:hypothetical protein